MKKILRTYLFEIILFTILFLFSFWLMWHTFNYKDGTIYVASKLWSDFAAQIPLIRSFSWGKNFPPEYPLFPGEPIRYHFFFYFLVGFLEKAGLPLNWALNIPSIIGFFALLVLIYLLAKFLFKSKMVGLLAVIFFLFNSSFTFLEFFKIHPFSSKTISEIVTNNNFLSFGPYYGNKIISAFWGLNIYTNQRHLAGAYAIVLLAVYLLARSQKLKKVLPLWQIILLGILFGILPFYHKAVFLMLAVVLGFFFLFFSRARRPIFLIFLIAIPLILPQLIYQLKESSPSLFSFNPGYLVEKPLTIKKIFSYWFLNLGLSLFLIPLGVILAKKDQRKIFLSFLAIFFIGNLFQFSPEIAGNHKFFNLFIIIGNMFSAWAIYLIWQKKILGKIIAPILIFFLIFSGIIDFFPIKNDPMMVIADAPKNPDIMWIKKNTPPDAVFLNSSYLYHPASLAGRKIFLGWPYFPWSAGYDTNKRDVIREKILGAATADKTIVCENLKINGIQFVSLGKDDSRDSNPNFLFWKNNFLEVYNNPETGFLVYDVNKNCL